MTNKERAIELLASLEINNDNIYESIGNNNKALELLEVQFDIIHELVHLVEKLK